MDSSFAKISLEIKPRLLLLMLLLVAISSHMSAQEPAAAIDDHVRSEMSHYCIPGLSSLVLKSHGIRLQYVMHRRVYVDLCNRPA